jgi:nucleoside-diphosphate-sugar epimerase
LQVFKAEPSIEYIIHTASPFPSKFEDPVKDVLDPAIKGTTNVLRAAKKYGSQVKRIVITSSFAAMVNTANHPKVYDEASWNPISWEEAAEHRNLTYRGSKVSRSPKPQTLTTNGANNNDHRAGTC